MGLFKDAADILRGGKPKLLIVIKTVNTHNNNIHKKERAICEGVR